MVPSKVKADPVSDVVVLQIECPTISTWDELQHGTGDISVPPDITDISGFSRYHTSNR